jgi:anaerobic magnesium-protoporphyrin IX monomethyl ester cyclase
MIRLLLVSVVHPASEIEQRYPDLGLGYLAAVLQKAFTKNEVDIRIINKDFERVLQDYQPHLVGLRTVSQNYRQAQRMARMAREAGVPVLIGGIHISALPQSLDHAMTVACLGEGEETIVDLLRLYLDRGEFPGDRLAGVPGIAFWDGDRVALTGPRKPIADLDEIPFPARELLDIKRHSYMFTSRGCPHRCRFCASSAFWDRLRFFSANYVINEIGFLVEDFGAKFISFYDDMFISDIKRLRDIADGLNRTNLLNKIKFSCSCAAANITEEVAQILKAMNVVSVGMGLESGCDRTLKFLKGKAFSVEKNRLAVEILKKNRIAANASFVIGSPQETAAEIMETYDFIKTTPLNLVDVYVLMPYPGTPIWQYALSRGLVREDGDMDWERLNVNFEVSQQDAIILSEALTREGICQLYGKFRRQRFWRNLRNIWRHPFLGDLPRVAVKSLTERIWRMHHG